MISAKQAKILAFPYSKYDALICDGAVRSGKTSVMMVSFIDWAMRCFNGCRFGICGKTVDSAVKNIVVPYTQMSYANERYLIRWRRSDKILEVRRGKTANVFEVFGGKDEASAALIQGRTLAGVLLDEVALMPRSFVQQALARCSVAGSKVWFSCNPESPEHWFYKEWICKAKDKNALYLRFAMTDNPSLSEETLRKYETYYEGVFYDRYVKGIWCVAEGLVYDFFGEDQITDEIPENGEYYISCDYGTLNPFSAGLWCWDGDKATRIREYYYSGREEKRQKTDEEYYTELEILASDYPVRYVIVDPSAASFIATIRRHGKFRVRQAKNDVVDGIICTTRLLKTGKMKIHSSCKDCIREFKMYRWDEKQSTDKPIKENDHAMDECRYFGYTILEKLVNQNKYKSIWM